MGYRLGNIVEVPGTISHRGGIIDIYPSTSDLPARLEFFGNTIDSIRLFDPAGQRSLRAVSSIAVAPATEKLTPVLDSKPFHQDSILNYLSQNALLILDEPQGIKLAMADLQAFHGMSGGLVGPATMSITADYSERIGKGRAMGFYGISMAAATLVGYGLSGVIASRLGYKAVFLFGAMLLTIGAVLSLLLPGSKQRGGMAAKTSLGETLKQTKDLLRRKGLTLAYCAIFAQYFTFGGVVTLLPIYVSNLGMEAFHVGMLLAIFAVMFIIFQFPSGALSDKVGRLVPAIGGLSLCIVSLVILPWLTTFPLLAAAMALYGVAYGLLFPSISALVTDHTLPEERGMATGLFHALLTAGVAIGAPIIGWVGEGVGVQLGLVLAAAIMVLALAVALTALKRT